MKERLIGHELIRSLICTIPNVPGIYKMFDNNQQVLYIGKAKNLRQRLGYYTRHDLTLKTTKMISLTTQLEYIVAKSEVEALLFEAQLVKKLQPKFNVLLKDDKSFPYLKLQTDHDYPQLIKYRGTDLAHQSSFGPFASSFHVDTTLAELQKIFKLRSCSNTYFASRKRPCLQYQIGRCSAPCVGKISKAEYATLVDHAIAFLSGKTNELQQFLARQMNALSSNLQFEAAAVIRDRIKALSYIQLKSSITDTSINDLDAIAIAKDGHAYCIQVFLYRNRQICGNKAYFPINTEFNDTETVLSAFISQFYQTHKPPSEIMLNYDLKEKSLLARSINKLHNAKSVIKLAHNAARNQLINNVAHNAEIALAQNIKAAAKNNAIFVEIKKLFNIVTEVERIEIYDNSHIMGDFAVGAMVVACKSGFDKKEYRLFNIRNNQTGDDYYMLRQVLTRRFKRLNDNKTPNLIIIDGGLGHLNIAQDVMREFAVNIPLVCMSKGPDRNAGQEQFHMNTGSFTLDKNSQLMRYLQILRDEAHNFAIKKHRIRRSKAIYISKLDNIQNIGKVRKNALLSYFGSYDAVCNASIEDLCTVKGISKTVADSIYQALHNS